MLAPCPPLLADDSPEVTHALTTPQGRRICKAGDPAGAPSACRALMADTLNRDRHTQCQRVQLWALKYLMNLVHHGTVGPVRGHASTQGDRGAK